MCLGWILKKFCLSSPIKKLYLGIGWKASRWKWANVRQIRQWWLLNSWSPYLNVQNVHEQVRSYLILMSLFSSHCHELNVNWKTISILQIADCTLRQIAIVVSHSVRTHFIPMSCNQKQLRANDFMKCIIRFK